MRKSRIFLAVAILLLPGLVFAHHGFFGRFDNSTSMVLEGEVTAVFWRNPHIHIFLDAPDDKGKIVHWDLESGSPTLMQRAGIPRDSIKAGMHIKVAAWPPLTDKIEAFATNVLLPDGEELVMQTGEKAKFKDKFIGDFSYRFRTEGDHSHPEWGLFRMWTFTGADGFLFPESLDRNYDLYNYPLTDAAKEVLGNFDLARDNPTNDCHPKGMPLIMEQPLPMEVVRDGKNVVLRIEEYDLRRTIHIGQDSAPEGTPYSLLGYSTGYWEEETPGDGQTLVAHTDHIGFPWFNQRGIPLSKQASIDERFTSIEDGSRMAYEMVVTDPVNFTEPVRLTKKWIHVPGVEILPFDCDEYKGDE